MFNFVKHKDYSSVILPSVCDARKQVSRMAGTGHPQRQKRDTHDALSSTLSLI